MPNYVYKPELDRWLDARTGATTVWHEHDGYRFSFDIRPDASRFIILRVGPGPHDREPVAKGLLDARVVMFDGPAPSAGELRHSLADVAWRMQALWNEMRPRLLELKKPR